LFQIVSGLRLLSVLTLVGLASAPPILCAWHNGGDQEQQPPKFGTHDYIALKALDRATAVKVAFIRQRLTSYFIGTEAPDTNKKIAGVTEGGYKDSLQCHCILFDKDEKITRAHARDLRFCQTLFGRKEVPVSFQTSLNQLIDRKRLIRLCSRRNIAQDNGDQHA
jgi:hypothetical protein